MLEPWRSHYLQAMGVEIYLPRRELPAAAPSPQWEWDENAYQTTAPSKAIEAIALSEAIADVVPPQRRNSGVPTLPATDSPIATRHRAPAVAPAKTTAAPVLQIKLQMALADSGVLIVDDVPAQPSHRNEMKRLWGSLLFALYRKPSTLQLEQFDWPLPNLRNKQIELNETAARETLAGFLSKKIQSDNFQTIILLGDNAQYWINPTQFLHQAEEHPLRWLSSIGTQTIFSDPKRKQQWWLDLRQLVLPH